MAIQYRLRAQRHNNGFKYILTSFTYNASPRLHTFMLLHLQRNFRTSGLDPTYRHVVALAEYFESSILPCFMSTHLQYASKTLSLHTSRLLRLQHASIASCLYLHVATSAAYLQNSRNPDLQTSKHLRRCACRIPHNSRLHTFRRLHLQHAFRNPELHFFIPQGRYMSNYFWASMPLYLHVAPPATHL